MRPLASVSQLLNGRDGIHSEHLTPKPALLIPNYLAFSSLSIISSKFERVWSP